MADPIDARGTVRQRGLKKILVGGLGSLAMGALLYWLIRTGAPKPLNQLSLCVTLVPAIWLIAGLMEGITGVSVGSWAKRWDSLRGWQRGAIGISLVAAILLVFGLAAALYFSTQK